MTDEDHREIAYALLAMATAIGSVHILAASFITEGVTAQDKLKYFEESSKSIADMYESVDRVAKKVADINKGAE
ncbi:hypothetical protein [uncultured Rhodospira sp.]|uniref:hypothetical protein n=1 Tax=uncultured Rhodospira sp. TaxID=1936189 RepID=UPI002636A326|nr:hypothetical protein [uncultured Rhodospira sp.]